MKKILLFAMLCFLIGGFVNVQSQIKDPEEVVKKKGTSRTNKKVDDSIDKGLDKIEEGLGGLFGKKKKKKQPETPADSRSNAPSRDVQGESGEPVSSPQNQSPTMAWSKFDFVPGDVIIFEDNQENEENGEFPSKWDLKEGNVEIAKYGDDYVINFATTSQCLITPLMDEQGDYLPEKFTLEFDAYFSEFCTTYNIFLYDIITQKRPSSMPFVVVRANHVSVEGFGGTDTGLESSDYPLWKHISISFNVRALKVYFGENRLCNIPNLRAQPTGITVRSSQCHAGKQSLIKNIRIARGSKKLYDRVVTDGKIVTTGIRFDSGKATIKPESEGILKKIYNLMADHTDLNFSVEGHTDNVGEEEFNMELSEKRAQSVKNELVKRGISADRLTIKGLGESKPLHANNTPEGKANNRRVEFVKK